MTADSLERDEQELGRVLAHARGSTAAPRPKRRGATKATRIRIGERDGWICRLCGEPVDKDTPWRLATKVPEHVVAQAAAILEQGVEHVVAWVGSDTDRARAVLARWFLTTACAEHRRLSTELRDLQRQLRPYAGTASDIRLRFQVSDAQAAADAASERVFGEVVAGEPSAMDAVRAIEAVYLRRNHGYPTVEHMVPVVSGGGDDDANLALAHFGCNIAWNDRGKDADVENRAEAYLAWRADRPHARDRLWDQERTEAVAKFRAAEHERRANLFALWTEDDQLRGEFRRLGDQLRVTAAEKERIVIKSRRTRITTKREKIRRRVNRLEVPDLVIGQMSLLYQSPAAAPAVSADSQGQRASTA